MSIVTDSTPVEAPKNPETDTLFALYKLFVNPEEAEDMAERYRSGGLGYGEVKKELIELIWNFFAPYRERHSELMNDKPRVRKILLDGAEKARYHASRTMQKVRRKVGAVYFKDK
jgi:tryptophanyl-tRNA synthetase